MAVLIERTIASRPGKGEWRLDGMMICLGCPDCGQPGRFGVDRVGAGGYIGRVECPSCRHTILATLNGWESAPPPAQKTQNLVIEFPPKEGHRFIPVELVRDDDMVPLRLSPPIPTWQVIFEGQTIALLFLSIEQKDWCIDVLLTLQVLHTKQNEKWRKTFSARHLTADQLLVEIGHGFEDLLARCWLRPQPGFTILPKVAPPQPPGYVTPPRPEGETTPFPSFFDPLAVPIGTAIVSLIERLFRWFDKRQKLLPTNFPKGVDKRKQIPDN